MNSTYQDYSEADEEPINVPANITMADLYVVLVKQNRRQAKFEEQVNPIVKVYKNYINWKRGIAVWMGILLAVLGIIDGLQQLWSLLVTHFVVK